MEKRKKSLIIKFGPNTKMFIQHLIFVISFILSLISFIGLIITGILIGDGNYIPFIINLIICVVLLLATNIESINGKPNFLYYMWREVI